MDSFADVLVDVDTPVAASHRGTVAAIGNFDGLHRGHRALIDAARRMSTSPAVVSFWPHPVKVLAPHLAPPLILRLDEKKQLLAQAGVTRLFTLPFTPALSMMAPEPFVRHVLLRCLGLTGVVVGDGFRFGHQARGTIDDLKEAFGNRVVVVDAVKEGGLVCSSTKVRELVMSGNVEAAALLLGRPYNLEGVVVDGDKRGRTIGIPTANQRTDRELLPKVGVYASRTILDDGRIFSSVTNVGLRPTFQGAGDVRIETHLFDFTGDLYGRRINVELRHRIRDEQRFSGLEALKAQIANDIATAKRLLG